MQTTRLVCVALGVISACAGLVPTAASEPLRVVAAGDSITNGYAYQRARLQEALDATGEEAVALHANYSGHTAQQFVDADGVAALLAHDPDVVALMLGTNDANRASWNPVGYDSRYYEPMSEIFNAIDEYANGRSRAPTVVLLNLLPTLEENLAPSVDADFATRVTETEFNPWLAEQAESRGYLLADVHSLITSQPNWQAMYNDGIHLWGDGERGYYLMADFVAALSIAAVPEPTAGFALIVTGFFALRRRR